MLTPQDPNHWLWEALNSSSGSSKSAAYQPEAGIEGTVRLKRDQPPGQVLLLLLLPK